MATWLDFKAWRAECVGTYVRLLPLNDGDEEDVHKEYKSHKAEGEGQRRRSPGNAHAEVMGRFLRVGDEEKTNHAHPPLREVPSTRLQNAWCVRR